MRQPREMRLGKVLYKWTKSGAVYVHWPFCSQLCTYCNFNKYVRSNVDHVRMTRCLVEELKSLLALSGIGNVTSVYFGGGTPSLAHPTTLEAVLSTVRDHSQLQDKAEVTLEANPNSVETEKLRGFKMAGITRLSIGVQSFVDNDLKWMNRDHSVAESMRCLSEAQRLFPSQFSIDMIFGRPYQTTSSWMKELKQVQDVCSKHVSLYQLTVEHGTHLARAVKRKEVDLPHSDTIAEMYEASVEILESAGLKRYEISNFSTPGYESRHNLAYWSGSNYLGVGPGAHSRFLHKGQFACSVNTLEPNAWMHKVTTKGTGLHRMRLMNSYERLEEVLATSMRTTVGLTNEIWERLNPTMPLQEAFSGHRLVSSGHILVDRHGMQATNVGLCVLDSILPELLSTLDPIILSSTT